MRQQTPPVAAQSTMPALERFLMQAGLDEMQALQLLRGAVQHQAQVMERARQVVDAMEAIDDARFTPETLRANPDALRAIEEGMSVGEVYRTYFLRRQPDFKHETEANLGLAGYAGDVLTPAEIERISAYVAKTGNRYELD